MLKFNAAFATFKITLIKAWTSGIILAFCAGGLVFFGVTKGIEATSTTEFCSTACHEMTQLVVKEWQQTAHFSNRSGVQAGCPDCHIPREFPGSILRKFEAGRELYHKIAGTVDTPEKFERHRLKMAKKVWQEMRETDSANCRSCHKLESMAHSLQKKIDHEFLTIGGQALTCIDCHKGVAHKMPEMTPYP